MAQKQNQVFLILHHPPRTHSLQIYVKQLFFAKPLICPLKVILIEMKVKKFAFFCRMGTAVIFCNFNKLYYAMKIEFSLVLYLKLRQFLQREQDGRSRLRLV
ncbi:hypothetical protein B7982_01285 [Fibrobacter sp. UWB2]|nr:hypothetical protein B7982_01285 [Fibrobacter sp. UWB2]